MRIGLDQGGTKIEAIALEPAGREVLRLRIATPRQDYNATLAAIAGLVREAERQAGAQATVGIGIPGTVSAATGLVKNANSTWLIGKPLADDLRAALKRDVRLANDANCFALSEASDGAGAGARVVFGIILGTGVGGGLVVDGKVLEGAHGIGGEWGHIPLPGMSRDEIAEAPLCYCGKRGCVETWCSGPGLAADFKRATGKDSLADQIAASQEKGAKAAMARFTDRLARGLATVVNIVDPDVLVLGGGLSNIESLYRELPPLVARYAFTPESPPRIVKNKHGDSSGVRGAAWLWPATP
jgi:fructokinase